jgi:hypothetical protein
MERRWMSHPSKKRKGTPRYSQCFGGARHRLTWLSFLSALEAPRKFSRGRRIGLFYHVRIQINRWNN